MRGRGSDQGGRWPVGIWFALVGVSAGTVASFGMVGWTFAVGLYDFEDAGEPVAIDSGTVVFEAQERPGAPSADDLDLEPPVGPGSEPADEPSPIEPQVDEVPAAAPDHEEERAPVEEAAPPKLVPVDEPEPECDREEGAEDEAGNGADGGTDDGSDDWYEHWEGDTGWRWDEDRESGRHGDADWSDELQEARDHRRDADHRLIRVEIRAAAPAGTGRG